LRVLAEYARPIGEGRIGAAEQKALQERITNARLRQTISATQLTRYN
jgi:hypothetical protein